MKKQMIWGKRAAWVGVVAAAVGTTACGAQKAGAPAPNKAEKKAAAAVPVSQSDPVLLQAMDTELKRAMASLGSAAPDGGVMPVSGGKGAAQPQPKPYFLSYSVADSESVNITAGYGAITNSTGTRQRTAD